MKGRDVLRKAGWDTHGLPVELEVEKQLGLDGKSQIEIYGIEPFIEECKKSVWKYLREWEEMGGGALVLPQSLAAMLSDVKTYGEGIRALKKRHSDNALLKTKDLKKSRRQDAVFKGTDEEYDAQVKLSLWNYSPKTMKILQKAKNIAAKQGSTGENYALYGRYVAYLESSVARITDDDLAVCQNMPAVINSHRQMQTKLFQFLSSKENIVIIVIMAIFFMLIDAAIMYFAMHYLYSISNVLRLAVLYACVPLFIVSAACAWKRRRVNAELKRYVEMINKKFSR